MFGGESPKLRAFRCLGFRIWGVCSEGFAAWKRLCGCRAYMVSRVSGFAGVMLSRVYLKVYGTWWIGLIIV